MKIRPQPTYYVAFFTTNYESMEEVIAKAPDALAAHISRSNELHKKGKLLMAGAFSNDPGEPVTTMGIFYTREDAEEYAKADSFVISGMVREWRIRKWANIFKD